MKADWSWKPDGKFVQPPPEPKRRKPRWLKRVLAAKRKKEQGK